MYVPRAHFKIQDYSALYLRRGTLRLTIIIVIIIDRTRDAALLPFPSSKVYQLSISPKHWYCAVSYTHLTLPTNIAV